MDKQAHDKFFAEVERDERGEPLVLHQYGLKKVKDGGKTYMAPMSKDELIDCLVGSTGKDRATVISENFDAAGNPFCVIVNLRCYERSGCMACEATSYNGSGYFCVCTRG